MKRLLRLGAALCALLPLGDVNWNSTPSAAAETEATAAPLYQIIYTDAHYYGVSDTGCQGALYDFPPFEYQYPFNQQYNWWDQAHQDCDGTATQYVGVLSGSPTLPQNMDLWFKPDKGIAVEWNVTVYAGYEYEVPTAYLGDATGDNVVNIDDYNVLYNAYGCTNGVNACYNSRADFDNDGTVGVADYSLGFGQGQFGMSGAEPFNDTWCPPVCWGPAKLPNLLTSIFAAHDYGR